MKFFKEYLIIIVILVIVFVTDYVTNKRLVEAVGWMKEEITSIENKISEKKETEAQQEFYELEEKWKQETEKLSLFVEHDELEKVSTNIVIIESNFETDETDKVLENIAEVRFLLEHIEEKNQLKLKNIF